jgi:preprotein translocase subunit SecE
VRRPAIPSGAGFTFGLASPKCRPFTPIIDERMKNPVEFFREVRQEGARITWPGRRETLSWAMMIFIFVAVSAVFFLVVDKLIAFVVKLLLGVG